MKAALSTSPLAVLFVVEKVNDLGDGTFTAEANGLRDPNDGSLKYGVVSVQENGLVQWRSLGTTGPFERFTKPDAKTAVFSPRGTTGYVFAFVEGMPNS